MSDPYAAGSVWWGVMDFKDGEGPRRKYFVLLTDCPANGDQAIVAMATSKGDKRYPGQSLSPTPCGCPRYSCFRIDAKQEACFPIQTWVQFDNVHHISRPSLVTLAAASKAGFLQPLNAGRLRAVLNCAKNSRDLDGRSNLRLDQTLKALPATGTASKPPPPPPPFSALDARFKRHCGACQAHVPGLLRMSGVAFAAVIAGKSPPPPNFEADAMMGLDMAGAVCPTCSKLT